jgi:tryptophan synthase alpha chain
MGDPDVSYTADLVGKLCENGADIIELGLPFSDPIADGPTIQQAMGRSLSGGFRTRDTFSLIRNLRDDGIAQPFVVMTYYNPVLRYGVERFCKDLSHAGGNGILIVDLPLEESATVDLCAEQEGLDVIRLVTPSTDRERMQMILGKASGFVYAVSVSGVTGARSTLPDSAKTLLRNLRKGSDIPVALGFGISRPGHVSEAIAAGADAVVEGSALIGLYSKHGPKSKKGLEGVARHVRSMKRAAKIRT